MKLNCNFTLIEESHWFFEYSEKSVGFESWRQWRNVPSKLEYLTIYFTIIQHFGTRGCQEHHQLQGQDLNFICDPQTQQTLYVEWVEGLTKTRQGGLTKMERRLPQKMFATGDERCPVKFLENLYG